MVDQAGELELLAVRLLGEQRHDLLDDSVHVEIDRLELELPGLDLREIEDVVDEGQERLPRGPQHVHELPLLAAEIGLEKKPRHADHAVHRRADLVTHVGQELGLGARRRLGRLLRPAQRLLGLPAVGDVLDRSDALRDPAAGVAHHRRARMHPVHVSARRPIAVLVLEFETLPDAVAQFLEDTVAIVGMNRPAPPHTQTLLESETGERLPARVRVKALAAGVGLKDPDRRRLAELAETLLASGKIGGAGQDLLLDRGVGRFELGPAAGNASHLLDPLQTRSHQEHVREHHPPGVLDRAPDAGGEHAVDRLRPEHAAQEVVDSHDDGGRNQDGPVAIERQERQGAEHDEVRLDPATGEMDQERGEQHLGDGNRVAGDDLSGTNHGENDREAPDQPSQRQGGPHMNVDLAVGSRPGSGRDQQGDGDRAQPLGAEKTGEQAIGAPENLVAVLPEQIVGALANASVGDPGLG